jgi:hypothetical protein
MRSVEVEAVAAPIVPDEKPWPLRGWFQEPPQGMDQDVQPIHRQSGVTFRLQHLRQLVV